MLESYAVGAVFRVQDESAATLTAIERRIVAIDTASSAALKNMEAMAAVRFGGMSNSLAGIDRRIASITAKSAVLRTEMASNMEASAASMALATESAVAMTAAMTEAAGAARAIGRANMSGSGGSPAAGARSRSLFGGGNTHVNASVPVGPAHARVGMDAATGILGTMLYGAYEEAEVEHTAMRMKFTGGLPITGGPGDPTMQQIRSLVQDTMTKTGKAPTDVEAAMRSAVQLMGGTEFQKRMGVMPDIMSFAGMEANLKDVTLKEASDSMIELMHMTGQYEPDQMRGAAAKLAYVSTISPLSLGQITRSAGYVVPTLKAGLGMDPNMLLLLAGQMQQAGIVNTKSGTWLSSFFTRLDPKTSLPGIVTKRGQDKQTEALRDLGMVDKKGTAIGLKLAQSKDLDDYIKLVTIIHDNIQKLNKAHAGGGMIALKVAFGEQGARAASLLTSDNFIARLPELHKEAAAFRTGPEEMAKFVANDPVLKFQSALRDLQAVMMDIGQIVLPPLVSGLHGIDDALKSILGTAGVFGPKKLAADAGKSAAAGAAIGFILGGPAGAAVGAGIGASAASAAEIRNNMLKGAAPFGQTGGSFNTLAARRFSGRDIDASGDLPAAIPQGDSSAFPKGGKSTPSLTVGSIVIHSATDNPDAHADAVIDALHKKLNQSFPYNLGGGEGSMSSPYTSGGGP